MLMIHRTILLWENVLTMNSGTIIEFLNLETKTHLSATVYWQI